MITTRPVQMSRANSSGIKFDVLCVPAFIRAGNALDDLQSADRSVPIQRISNSAQLERSLVCCKEAMLLSRCNVRQLCYDR